MIKNLAVAMIAAWVGFWGHDTYLYYTFVPAQFDSGDAQPVICGGERFTFKTTEDGSLNLDCPLGLKGPLLHWENSTNQSPVIMSGMYIGLDTTDYAIEAELPGLYTPIIAVEGELTLNGR